MHDQEKSKQQLVDELAELRRRVAAREDADVARKSAEEALRESEDELQTIYEGMIEGLLITDIETKRFLRVNPSICRMLGYSESELLASSLSDIHPAEEVPNDLQRFQAAADGRVSINEDRPVLRKNGTIFYADITGHRIFYEERPCLLALFRDVTERRQVEEEMRRNRELLQAIIDNTPALIYVKDLEGRLTVANRALCEAVAGEMHDILGKGSRDFVADPRDAEIHVANDRRVIETEEAVTAEECSLGRTFLSVKFPLKDNLGQVFGVGGVSTDITDRKIAQEALRQSEERYRTVVQDQTEVICRILADGTLTFVSDVYCRFFGKSRDSLVGCKWQPNAWSEDVPVIEEQLRTLSPTNPIVVVENRVYSGRGEIRWMQFVNRGFFDQEGHLTEIQCVGRDITERKQAEAALRKEHRNLKLLLQSSDIERQAVAYEIHDGLAQHLAAAIMQIQSYRHLKDKSPEDASRAYDSGLTMLQQGHCEARRLIAGLRPPILDESGVREAIAHLVHEQDRDNGPRIEFHSRVEFDRLDPTLENTIYRIAQEALTNACKYSRSERIWVSLVQREDRLRIEIRDWGVGFSPKAVPKNHFGLEGIRQRARLLGGKCSIRSTIDKGSRVIVELPVILRADG